MFVQPFCESASIFHTYKTLLKHHKQLKCRKPLQDTFGSKPSPLTIQLLTLPPFFLRVTNTKHFQQHLLCFFSILFPLWELFRSMHQYSLNPKPSSNRSSELKLKLIYQTLRVFDSALMNVDSGQPTSIKTSMRAAFGIFVFFRSDQIQV